MLVREVLIKYFINILVHFGYIYIYIYIYILSSSLYFIAAKHASFFHLQNELNRPGHNVNHLSPSSIEYKEALELYLRKNGKYHSGL